LNFIFWLEGRTVGDIMRHSNLIASATAVVGATFGISVASAADLPARTYTKAPSLVVSPLYNWSGFYIGINGGGGSSRKCWEITNVGGAPVIPAVGEGCHDATGGTVGGQVGYRWQSAAWVFGVEAQGNWASFKGSNPNQSIFGFAGGIIDQSKINAFGLFTGQVGYAVNNVLFYAKGGAAVVRDRYNNVTLIPLGVPAGTVFSEGTETRWGAVAGVGVEFGFAPNWSVGLEYDHLFMGTKSVTLNLLPPLGPGVSGIHNIRQDIDIGTVRVNYRFGGPVVAKY
jgi:outer membrane immunogenic protein